METKRTILITGSNRGIGYEIARQCARQNFRVIISGRSEQKLQQAYDQLIGENLLAEILVMDVGDPASINAAAAAFKAMKTPLHVLVNNAGIGVKGDKSLSTGSDEVFSETLNTNAYGALRVTRAFLPFINSPGRIVMISSGGGSMTDEPGGWWPAYCVSKSLLNAITRHLASELELKNIAVNAVCPGWVRTEMGGAGASRSVVKGAETPVWLASDAPQDLTGMFLRDKKVIPW
jgi:NAD(P)-dependent dehydrogenase (short-subunit alcohol dehydrogenase family)